MPLSVSPFVVIIPIYPEKSPPISRLGAERGAQGEWGESRVLCNSGEFSCQSSEFWRKGWQEA